MTRILDPVRHERTLARLREVTPPIQRAPARTIEAGGLPRRTSLLLGAAWVAALVAITLTAPPPDPAATEPLWADLLAGAVFVAMLAAFTGLALRQRWGAGASFGAAAGLFGLSVGCVAMGHPLDTPLTTQLLAGGGLAGLSGWGAVAGR